VIPGQGLWSGGSGTANRATKEPVTGRTPFPIASITKTFIAALAIKLADQHLLRLDDPLGRWLPNWPNADKISLRQLLNHTSGVANFEQRITAPYQRAIDAHPAKLWSPQRTLSYAGKPEFAPGTRWEYNNANYILAGLAIERATRSTVARQLHRELLDPLKLDDIVLQPQERPRGTPPHGYGSFTSDERRALRAGGPRFTPYDSAASSAWTGGDRCRRRIHRTLGRRPPARPRPQRQRPQAAADLRPGRSRQAGLRPRHHAHALTGARNRGLGPRRSGPGLRKQPLAPTRQGHHRGSHGKRERLLACHPQDRGDPHQDRDRARVPSTMTPGPTHSKRTAEQCKAVQRHVALGRASSDFAPTITGRMA
jgi:CubicO group peptidase (beta-lactamase class C family)